MCSERVLKKYMMQFAKICTAKKTITKIVIRLATSNI